MEIDIFNVRDYSHKKNVNLVKRECVICQRTFSLPKHQKDTTTTCCNYCQRLALSWKKMTGYYKLCKMCDKSFWMRTKKIAGKYCSKKCHNLALSKFPQENNLGKIQTGRKKYYGANWLNQRKLARKRDNYCCLKCGISEIQYGQELSVHHITPFVYFETYEEANRLENLMSLCEPCHRKEHSGDNHHYKFTKEKIVFKNELNKVTQRQREKAIKVVQFLFNTDKSLREISDETGLSYGKVQKIYKGERWKELYERPARIVRPRTKNIAIAKIVYENIINTNWTLTKISKEVGCSLAMVQDIYKGNTWKELYGEPAYLTHPRQKANEIGKMP
ncbi:HNH endonuclease [Niallia circulans]|uniref:HNH endonuclease n=1 Tax=Niallia circulans TaxID=1397 RepID=UPI00201E2E8B|nr:HNH endonuclease [Niallia circulans]UQZ76194.1 HNH endonuclease [Niallia circulans]